MEALLVYGIPWSHRMSWEVFPLLFFVFWVFFIYFKKLFIFGCTESLLLCMDFLQLWRAEAPLQFQCLGFSCCRTSTLELSLRSRVTQAQLPHGMWNFPGPGIEPMSPFAGGFLTTGPPGKVVYLFVYLCQAQIGSSSCSTQDVQLWQADSYSRHVGSISLTTDQACAPCIGRTSHWTTREAPPLLFFFFFEEFETSWNFCFKCLVKFVSRPI